MCLYVCDCVCMCVSLSADASGPTECEMEQGGSGFSRDTAKHTHTHTSLSVSISCSLTPTSPPLLFASLYLHFPLLSCFSHFHFHSLPALPSLFPLSFHLSHFLYISPSLLYSAALSLWIKLSLLWSLFFPPALPLSSVWMPCMCRSMERET